MLSRIKSSIGRLLEEIKEIENTRIHYDKEDKEYFEFRKGKIPILISAPHGARHWRDNNWKEEDEYTSSIAIKLAEQTGAYVIFVKNATREDPNYIEENRYKEAVSEVIKKYEIKFLLDLHGANKRRNFKVSVGIIDNDIEKCSCPTFKEIIQRAFSVFQDEIYNLDGLTASHPGTITCFARNRLGIEAAQIEINAKFRIVDRKPESAKAKKGEEPNYMAKEKNVLEFIKVMERVITEINRKITIEKS